ncbi:Heat shock protein DnaJ [Penicillium manginii]|uniref:Heat shock protein DnaJ n=1 Tax=Penicillium manginii TaxID=203109 RepID=UPI002546A394|nr:Heat shock protein DnaJ [Penicillium manginii]KAJ5756478.1 Heat shock protein DnaJ [Penicillium manginii]
MAKADVRKDYYADLGLAPSAEGDDIKKQFRKLALKYHPDKNPGKEAEFNAKFQAIKTAHDLLSDPHQRLKYDTDRLRAGYGKVSGPPKTNTSRRAQPQPTAFRPTPPRPQYNTSHFTKPPPASNGPSAGAKRYEAHARAGPQSWHKPQDEGQTRADAFKGFSGMRGAAGWRGFDPNTGVTERRILPRPPHSPKKRNGYAPGASGDDEPMARNTSAYTSSSRPSSMYFDSPPRAPTAKKPVAPDLPPFQPEYERASSRYATAGGEKTFFTSSGLGRSSTVRTPSGGYRTSSARTNPPSPTPSQHGRHRSVSPKSGRNRAYSVSETSSDLDDDEEDIPEPQPKPKAVPKSRMRHRQKFPDLYGNESSSSTGEDPRARQGQKYFRLSPSPEGFRKYRRNSGYQDGNADLYRDKGHNSDSAAFPKNQQGLFSNPASRYDALLPHSLRKSNLPFSPIHSPDSVQSKPTSQPTFGRDSPSNLHKKFSEEDWREHIDKFDFLGAHATSKDAFRSSPKSSADREKTAKLYRDFKSWKAENFSHPKFANMSINDPTQTPEANPSRTSPGSQSQSRATNSTGSFAPTTGTGPQPQPQPQQAPTPFAQAKFSADEWSEQLQNLSWNVSDAHKSRQGNTPPLRSPKKPARDNQWWYSLGVNTTPRAEVEPEAMDLDDEVPPIHPTASSASGHGSASGSANASYPDLNGNATGNASTASKETAIPHTVNGASKAETRTPLFNLDNLRNTAPFTSTNSGGIENLEDVFATLPFESKARQQTTTKEDIRPRTLDLPNPPKRPRAPELIPLQPGSQQLVLSRDKWNYYVSTMGSYMHDWNIFSRRMLLHFNTRQDAIETGLAPGWISAVGDTARLRMNGADGDATPEKSRSHTEIDEADIDDLVPDRRTGGYSAYLRGIEEDVQIWGDFGSGFAEEEK